MEIEKTFPIRKGTRLRGFDYSKEGSYFLTICTQNRKSILAKIVGEGSPLPRLSPYGEVVDKWIKRIPEKYPEASVDRYVIMPNHVHILLSIIRYDGRGDPSPTVDRGIDYGRGNPSRTEVDAIIGKISGHKGNQSIAPFIGGEDFSAIIF